MCEGGQIADVTSFGSSDIGWDLSEVCQLSEEGQGAPGLLSGSWKVGDGGDKMTTLISRAAGRAWKWMEGRAGCTIRGFQTLRHSILPPACSLYPLNPRHLHSSLDPSRPSPGEIFCSETSLSLRIDPSHVPLPQRDIETFTDTDIICTVT